MIKRGELLNGLRVNHDLQDIANRIRRFCEMTGIDQQTEGKATQNILREYMHETVIGDETQYRAMTFRELNSMFQFARPENPYGISDVMRFIKNASEMKPGEHESLNNLYTHAHDTKIEPMALHLAKNALIKELEEDVETIKDSGPSGDVLESFKRYMLQVEQNFNNTAQDSMDQMSRPDFIVKSSTDPQRADILKIDRDNYPDITICGYHVKIPDSLTQGELYKKTVSAYKEQEHEAVEKMWSIMGKYAEPYTKDGFPHSLPDYYEDREKTLKEIDWETLNTRLGEESIDTNGVNTLPIVMDIVTGYTKNPDVSFFNDRVFITTRDGSEIEPLATEEWRQHVTAIRENLPDIPEDMGAIPDTDAWENIRYPSFMPQNFFGTQFRVFYNNPNEFAESGRLDFYAYGKCVMQESVSIKNDNRGSCEKFGRYCLEHQDAVKELVLTTPYPMAGRKEFTERVEKLENLLRERSLEETKNTGYHDFDKDIASAVDASKKDNAGLPTDGKTDIVKSGEEK